MGSCHLKGEIGDRLHAVLCAAGYHIQWLLRMMARKGTSFVRRDYLRLCTVAGVSTNWELAQRQQPLPPEMNKLMPTTVPPVLARCQFSGSNFRMRSV